MQILGRNQSASSADGAKMFSSAAWRTATAQPGVAKDLKKKSSPSVSLFAV